ncbi:MAG: hypothetical protein PHG53_09605 [Phycisphaerae bacterium]|nr:hypothetical protein [Phycisphaerae bacterium]
MLALLTAAFQAIAAVFGYMTKSIISLADKVYKEYFSAEVKRKKAALKKADEAIDKGDRQGLLDAINDMKRIFIVAALLIISGCNPFEQDTLTPIYAIKGEELQFVKTVYDVNDPNKVDYYRIETTGKHTGAYLSNRVLKKIFKVEIK